MKKIFAALIGVALIAICQSSFAAPAVVSALQGSAQAIPTTGSPRALKDGDAVNEGDNVTTAENSSLVLRFEDGQIVAMSAKSRMAITTYKYNQKEPAKSSVFLSLVTGGMRAITGLIGKVSPDRVAYRAGNATIGIRGTDVTFATANGDVVVTVVDGAISFTFGGKTIAIPAGEAALTSKGEVTKGTIAAITAAVAANPNLAAALKSVSGDALQKAVAEAAAKAAAEAKAAADKAAADRAAAEKKAAADKLAAEQKAAADKLAAEQKAAADKLAADQKAAADAKAVADAKAAADAKNNNQGTTGGQGAGSGTTGAGGTGSGGGGKPSGG